jgi:hypothetical protein
MEYILFIPFPNGSRRTALFCRLRNLEPRSYPARSTLPRPQQIRFPDVLLAQIRDADKDCNLSAWVIDACKKKVDAQSTRAQKKAALGERGKR